MGFDPISAGIGLISSLLGRDNDVSASTTRTPSAMTPEQQRMYDQFINMFFGQQGGGAPKPNLEDYKITPSTSGGPEDWIPGGRGYNPVGGQARYDMDRYNKDLAAWEAAQVAATPTPSMQDMIGQDTEAVKTADQAYIDSTKTTNQALIDALTGSNAAYQTSIAPIINANQATAAQAPVNPLANALTVKFGDFSMPFTSGTQRNANTTNENNRRYAQNLINQLAGTTRSNTNELAERTQGLTGAENLLQNQFGITHTPNEANMNYWNILNDLVQKNEDRRYGTATSTTAANITPSIFDSIGGGLKLGDVIQNLLNPSGSTGGGGASDAALVDPYLLNYT